MSRPAESESTGSFVRPKRPGLYKRILDTLPDVVCAFDSDGRLEYVGPEGAAALGETAGKLLGKHWGEIGCSVDTAAAVEEQIQEVIESGLPLVDSRSGLLVEGDSARTYSISPRFCPNGEKNGAVMSIHPPGPAAQLAPQTERGDALSEGIVGTSATYRNVLDSLVDRVFVVDRDCRYVFMGEYALGRHGMRLAEVIGKHWSELGFPAEIMVPFEKELREVMGTGLPTVNRSLAYESAAQEFDSLDYTISPLWGQDREIEGAVCIARPVVSEKDLEAELRTYDNYVMSLRASPDPPRAGAGGAPLSIENWVVQQRLSRETTRLHRALLRSISHDFRTPLTGAVAVLREIAEEGSELPPSLIQELAKTGLGQVQRLERFLDNLLIAAQIDGARLSPQIEDEDPHGIISEVITRCAGELVNYTVEWAVERNLPLVSVDRMLFVQALGNVVGNAARYSPDNSVIALSAFAKGPLAFFRVEDEGLGFPTTELGQRGYDESERAARMRQRGLGLEITRAVLAAHGGKLQIEPRPNGGSAVSLIVPLREGR